MIELQLKTSEISTFGSPFKIMYVRWQKSRYRRLSKRVTPDIFLVFQILKFYTDFTILCYPNPQQGLQHIKMSILKKRLEKLEKLKKLEKLENRPTSNKTNYHTHQKTTKCSYG